MIMEEVNVNKEMVRQILTTNQNIKKYLPKWSQRIHQFLARKQIQTLEHAPYSPDLAPCDFFLFPELKCSLKGTHLQSVEDVHKETAELCKAFSQNDFRKCIKVWEVCMRQCVACDGNYFVVDNM
jgi:transposase